MTRALAHRGPDDEGYYDDPSVGAFLGHRRLSIIDLSAHGRQPMQNEDGSIRIVCNGEIYNYNELRTELLAAGHVFTSDCDSEVIVHAYEQWGEDAFARFNGMFAIAIWDSRNRRALLVRDPIGIKPLLYIDTSEGLFFASEVKAFLHLPPAVWRPEFDAEGLEEILNFQYLFHPGLSILKGVRKVLPGHFIRMDAAGVRQKPYWTLTVKPQFSGLPFEDAVRLCDEKLRLSVSRQMHADVPVGILLSGGLDSSLLAALASKVSPHRVHTFTAGFEHRLDERPYAAQVAEHVGSVHETVLVDPREINDRIEELIYYFDDLSSLDGGLFTIFLMTEKIRQKGIKVLLVGEGADEVFAGYSWYGLAQLPYRLMPAFVRSALFYYTISRLLPTGSRWDTLREVHRTFSGFREPDIGRQIHRFDITCELPQHFLMKEDRATMASAIEARVPYLDHEVVEFAYSLPRRYRFKGEWFRFHAVNEKHILRRVAQPYLPPEIGGRKKRGFSIPVPEMLMSNMDKVKAYLLAPGSLALERYSRRDLERMLRFRNTMYSPLEKNKEFMAWKLFLLEVWKTHYMRNRP